MSKEKINIEALNQICGDSLIGHLKIEFDLEEGQLIARMPVSQQHLQPMGILHGGASLAMAESLGSAYSFMIIDQEKYDVVGINVQANHVATISHGQVTARCNPLHIGSRTHVIDIIISDEEGKKISVCRLTNMIKMK